MSAVQARIEQRLGYHFKQFELLEQALTHRSFGPNHNERLEYLGDAILDVIIAKALYDRFPHAPEGDLTRMRANLVCEGSLAQLAHQLLLSEGLRVGPGEVKTGGARRDSLLSDAFEAVIGAMFVDLAEDYNRVRDVVMVWFNELLQDIHPGEQQKDPKSSLQELMQSQHQALPIYILEKTTGASNAQVFYVEVRVNGQKSCHGIGTTKRKAEQQAAAAMLEQLKG